VFAKKVVFSTFGTIEEGTAGIIESVSGEEEYNEVKVSLEGMPRGLTFSVIRRYLRMAGR